MTDDLDAALVEHPPEPETAVTLVTSDRRCRRHQWASDSMAYFDSNGDPLPATMRCLRCQRVYDPLVSRRGKSARRRGVDYERDVAAALGGVKVGHHGGATDVQTPLLNVQVKVRAAFPSWMSDELAKLPRTGGRTPALVVADTPEPGHKRRALVVMTLEDFRDLHGTLG